jgi:hypothetical protein
VHHDSAASGSRDRGLLGHRQRSSTPLAMLRPDVLILAYAQQWEVFAEVFAG